MSRFPVARETWNSSSSTNRSLTSPDDPIPSLFQLAGTIYNVLVRKHEQVTADVPGWRWATVTGGTSFRVESNATVYPTWNVNTLAAVRIFSYCVQRQADHEARAKAVIAEFGSLFSDLQGVPRNYCLSKGANFVLFRINGGMTAVELQAAVERDSEWYVRDGSNKIGMDNLHIRGPPRARKTM